MPEKSLPKKITSKDPVQQTWTGWAFDRISNTAAYAQQQILSTALEQMPLEMGRLLLYGITSDNVEKNTKLLDKYLEPARKAYRNMVATLPEFAADKLNYVLGIMFPMQLLVIGSVSSGLETFVNMKPSDKSFIVTKLFPLMPPYYQQEYLNLLKSKQHSSLKIDLTLAIAESFNKLKDGNKEEILIKKEVASLLKGYAGEPKIAKHDNFKAAMEFYKQRSKKSSSSPSIKALFSNLFQKNKHSSDSSVKNPAINKKL